MGVIAAASALGLAVDYDYRPFQGYAIVNVRYIPDSAQSVASTGDRQFFEVLLHEVFHALGIDSDLLERWTDSSTGSVYTSHSYEKVLSNHPHKTFRFLTTPKIHEVLSRRWGTEYFDREMQMPVGAEIEDQGGQGTAGSHWEGRVFFGELMGGWSMGYSSISELSLAALQDTGWYSVDHSLAEPLPWGDYRSIVGSAKLRSFPIGEPEIGRAHV
jgi:hypothetical protein